MTLVLTALRVALLAYAGYLVVAFVLQRSIAFPGTLRPSPRAAPTAPEGVEQIWLETSFGRVEAWLLPAASEQPAPVAVFGHGNGELIEDWRAAMSLLAAEGVHVLLVEFPGYGHSDGKPSRETIAEAFDAAFDSVAGRADVDDGAIVAWGRSMGGGAAADLALSRPVAALVLQSTFSSTAAMARAMYAPGFVVRDRFDPADVVARLDVPVLLMHGRRDEVIPFAHAERIAAAREGLEVVEIPCGHNDCAGVWPEITRRVRDFLAAEGLLP